MPLRHISWLLLHIKDREVCLRQLLPRNDTWTVVSLLRSAMVTLTSQTSCGTLYACAHCSLPARIAAVLSVCLGLQVCVQ